MDQPRPQSHADLRTAFGNPPRAARPLGLWLLDEPIDEKRVQWLLGQLVDKGLGGFDLCASERCDNAQRDHLVNAALAMGLSVRAGAPTASANFAAFERKLLDGGWAMAADLPAAKLAALALTLSEPESGGVPWILSASMARGAGKPYLPSQFYQAPAWPHLRVLADFCARLKLARGQAELLGESAPFRIDFDGDVLSGCWECNGLTFALLANFPHAPVNGALVCTAPGRVEAWDLESGTIAPAPLLRGAGGRLEIPIALAPCETLLFALDASAKPIALDPAPPRNTVRLPLTERPYHFTPYGGNFLRFENAVIEHGKAVAHYTVSKYVANVRLLADTVALAGCEVRIDGAAPAPAQGWEMDIAIASHECGAAGSAGQHVVELSGGGALQALLQQHVWLAGDFAVSQSGDAPALAPVPELGHGAWEAQGFPWFSGAAAYAADVAIPAEAKGRRIYLDAGKVGGVLDVEVNGMSAGVRLWPPYRIEITPYVRPGEQTLAILKVTNTAQNFFAGPDAACRSGLLDPVQLLMR